MGSSPKKLVKKVKKVASSPIGQLALSVAIGGSPLMAGIGGSGLAGSALRAGLTSGLVGVASGRGIDPKRMLTAGATAGLFKGVGNLQADRNFFDSGISNTGGISSALDPGKVKGVDTFAEEQFNPIAEQVNITPSAAPTSFRDEFLGPSQFKYLDSTDPSLQRAGVGVYPDYDIPLDELGKNPNVGDTFRLLDRNSDIVQQRFNERIISEGLSAGDVVGNTGDFPLKPNIKVTDTFGRDSTRGFTNDAAAAKAQTTAGKYASVAGEASDFVFDPSGNLRLFSPTNLKNVGNLALQGNLADAAKLTFQLTKDNPFETITALSAAAPLFFSPVPQEGESEEDFTQRKVDVTNYLRQYGSNFYSGKDLDDFISRATSNFGYSQGGRVEAMGGGIMGLGKMPMGTPRMNQGGVTELDYRAEGGFVPVGIKEKADDVPAMLSKNEFVMTADAVRSAGDGSIEKGAQKMYDTMKQLESRVV